jgi:hypothetical protein
MEVRMLSRNLSIGTNWSRRWDVAATIALLVLLAGCGGPGRSHLGGRVGEREVVASIDGSASILCLEDRAEVTFPGHKVTVEKERILLDGKEVGKAAPSARVEMDYSEGKLKLSADGKEISSNALAN